MTAPGPAHERSRLGASAVADGRGLTAAGAALVALVVGLLGVAFDLLTGSGLREAFAVAFVTGCVLAALAVHREDLFAVVVMPPLVYVVLAFVGGAFGTTAGSGSFLTRQAIELVNAVVIGAPVLMVATFAALVIAVFRWAAGRQ